MIHDSTDEYKEELLQCAAALVTLKQSGRFKGISLVATADEEEFNEDLKATYTAMLEDTEEEEQDEEDESDHDEAFIAIMPRLKLMTAALAKLISTQSVHDQAIKELLKGKL